MIEWKNCPRCNIPCILVPISPLFDPMGERYGLLFKCPTCTYYSCDKFYNKKDVEYIDEHESTSDMSTEVPCTNNTVKEQQQQSVTENDRVQDACNDIVMTLQTKSSDTFFDYGRV